MSDRYENRESKLPIWAQAKLERLRRTITEKNDVIDKMNGVFREVGPRILADPYLHKRVVGVAGDSLWFGVGVGAEDDNYIEVRLNPLDRGCYSLLVRGRDGDMIVSPNQANSVTIWMAKR